MSAEAPLIGFPAGVFIQPETVYIFVYTHVSVVLSQNPAEHGLEQFPPHPLGALLHLFAQLGVQTQEQVVESHVYGGVHG